MSSEEGFQLENIIHTASLKIPGLTHSLKENDIRSHFSDTSLNGVDHWIQINTKHVLIQDKWKETNTQQEVAQFITCAERIQSRLPPTDTVYLIWVCKKEPTANSRKTLEERGVSIIACSINLEGLARCAILQISECFESDPTLPLQAIIRSSKPTPFSPSRNIIGGGSSAPVTFDESEEGKKEIELMKNLITQIHNGIFKKGEMIVSSDYNPDVNNLWNGQMPKSVEDWSNGRISKIDFTAFMKAIKTICWPTNKKKLMSRELFIYTKFRKLTGEFSKYTTQYDSLRKSLLGKKSVWAKQLSTLKAVAEPISESEFKGALENCEDYMMLTSRNGQYVKIPNAGLQHAFYSHQCTVY